MSLTVALKALSGRERLSEDAARRATAALLDGGVPELEQGALLALRGRIGFGAFAERLGRFVNPFGGEGLAVIAAADDQERRLLRAVLRERAGNYLLLDAGHGDAFADPRRRPVLELIRNGKCE